MTVRAPTEYSSLFGGRLLWLTDGFVEVTEIIYELCTEISLLPLPRRPDAEHRHAEIPETPRGKLKFSAGWEIGEAFKGLVHTSLCSQHVIFLIRSLAVGTHLFFNMYSRRLLKLTKQSQHLQSFEQRGKLVATCQSNVDSRFMILEICLSSLILFRCR